MAPLMPGMQPTTSPSAVPRTVHASWAGVRRLRSALTRSIARASRKVRHEDAAEQVVEPESQHDADRRGPGHGFPRALGQDQHRDGEVDEGGPLVADRPRREDERVDDRPGEGGGGPEPALALGLRGIAFAPEPADSLPQHPKAERDHDDGDPVRDRPG